MDLHFGIKDIIDYRYLSDALEKRKECNEAMQCDPHQYIRSENYLGAVLFFCPNVHACDWHIAFLNVEIEIRSEFDL